MTETFCSDLGTEHGALFFVSFVFVECPLGGLVETHPLSMAETD